MILQVLILMRRLWLKQQESCVRYDYKVPVAKSVKRWTCDWKVAGSNPGLEGPRGTGHCFGSMSFPCLSDEA